jgi:methylase of polypeptide subunit release factors
MIEFRPGGKLGLTVYHDSWMEGGGTWFGQEYVDVITTRYPDYNFNKCYEWCSGPGFIGFALLDHQLCQSLCVSDIYESAINKAVKATARQVPELVSAYHTGTLSDIPAHEMFDLVVANPPHFLECPGDDNYQRIAVDKNWQAHQNFFQHIAQHLTPNGIILLQENQAGSLNREKDFEQYINSNSLQITDVFDSPKFYTPNDHTQIYYIEIKLAK